MSKNIDVLFTNAIVLTMDTEFSQYDPGAVAVEGDCVVAAGPEEELKAEFQAKDVIDCGGKVLMPGLVNAHTHVPMTLLRGLADDLRLDVWLLGYMMPVEREYVSPKFVRLGTQLGCAEMIRSGVTCFADMYYFEEHIAQAVADTGMRAVCSQTVLKFPAPDAEAYEDSLAAAEAFIQRWKGHPLIEPSIAPHAPYTCTDEILRASADIAIRYDVPLHTHIAETALEVENSREEYGMPVVPYAKKQGIFDAKVLAAHCVHVDDGEIITLHHNGAGVAHCPSSNLKLASGIAPVSKMLEENLNVGIGTDGTASNNDLDMFEEVRLAAFIAKTNTGDPTALPAKTALKMATIQGAKALHLDHLTGSIVPGKRADLILVDLTALHNSPRFKRDPDGVYAQIVYAAKSGDVSDVMVNGRWLMREHELLTVDTESVLVEAAEYARQIDAFLVEREKSVLSKLIAIGGASQEESFEVQAKVRIPDTGLIWDSIANPEVEILYERHYHEFDTYFLFEDPKQGVLRHREDEFMDKDDQITDVRYRLTLIGQERDVKFPSHVLLSRSRYLAKATHSLRFYREYFKPSQELFIEKHRYRWRVLFRGTEFYVNLDCIEEPGLGSFLEVKSRTWSRRDAEFKAETATKLVEYLAGSKIEPVTQDYIALIRENGIP